MDPRYPIGDFQMPAQVTPERRRQAIEEIASTPAKMRAAVKGLNDAQLDTPYRDGGWTVRQVVHHVPLKPQEFARTLVHPDHKGDRNVDWLLFLYEWHGKHHVAHINELRKKKGW